MISILIADDDADDRQMTQEALHECRLVNDVHFVEDGEQLLDHLFRRGAYAHLAGTPLPGLILLDLNMPRKDGREALKEIKAHPDLRRIPIVVLTTSKAEEDILRTYDGDAAQIRMGLDFLERLAPVFARHVQVEQDQTGQRRAGQMRVRPAPEN